MLLLCVIYILFNTLHFISDAVVSVATCYNFFITFLTNNSFFLLTTSAVKILTRGTYFACMVRANSFVQINSVVNSIGNLCLVFILHDTMHEF